MLDKPKDTLQLIVHESDIPRDGKGTLIPASFVPKAVMVQPKRSTRALQVAVRSVLTAAALFVFLLAGTVGYGVLSQVEQVASPIVTIVDPYTLSVTELDYGPQVALAQYNFFTETRDAFVEDSVTFIEVDITRKQLRFFVEGVLVESAPIVGLPERGSWWDIPSGLYEVDTLDKNFFSNLAQAQFPWAIRFEENLVIHGQPRQPDGTFVGDTFSGGGIELATEDAQTLFNQVSLGVPVLVHAAQDAEDTFVYEPPVPDIDVPQYFVADISNGAVLASNDLHGKAPIASLTKLMTALVAAEELQLDDRVFVTSPSFVTSLIPRLSNRSSVSMYSLLQLLLVESSNEAAEVIASQMERDEFIAAMNTKARQIGMLNTTFTDPSGLDAGNISTAGDLYRLTEYIYTNRQFIFDMTRNKTTSGVYIGGDFAGLVNFNEIEDVTGFVGGKVGETTAAGQTSISLHELEIAGSTRTVVVIILGSQSRTADVQTLVNFVEERFGD